MKLTIDFSRCRLHKQTKNGFVITGCKPRYNKKGDFGTDQCFLAFSQVEIISHKKNEGGFMSELIIKIPKWIFDKGIEGKKDIISRIKIVGVEKEEDDDI